MAKRLSFGVKAFVFLMVIGFIGSSALLYITIKNIDFPTFEIKESDKEKNDKNKRGRR